MAKNTCNKTRRVPMDRKIAEAKTRANKIRRMSAQLRRQPNNFVLLNALNQLRHDAGLPIIRLQDLGE